MSTLPPDHIQLIETARDGASRTYRLIVDGDRVDQLAAERLSAIGQSVRVPGFRPGKIPAAILQQRYGAKTRAEAIGQLAAEAPLAVLPEGCLISSAEVTGEAAGLEMSVETTYLPDLPPFDPAGLVLERLVADEWSDEEKRDSSDHLRRQLMDALDAAYKFRIAPPAIARELDSLRQAAAKELGAAPDEDGELRAIAERRVRLGVIIAELARRHGIERGPQMEERVIGWMLAQVQIRERRVTNEELDNL